jgi:hypothetical protein
VRDQPCTALLVVGDPQTGLASRAEMTHRLTRFFMDLQFAVSFQKPNLLVVTGSELALLKALTRLARDPASGADAIRDILLCAGAWSPPPRTRIR